MVGWRWVIPRWVENTVRGRDRQCQITGKETEYLSDGRFTTEGLDMGYINNSFITITDRS